MIRKDKFKIGQKVTWDNDDMATITGGRFRFGNGPFVLVEVIDVQEYDYWHSMGHTQHVKIDAGGPRDLFSGMFFKLVEES